ncbi:High mobility group B protein 15 [Linum perenne]
MASTSCAKQILPVPMRNPVVSYIRYPAPVAEYEDVKNNPRIFMASLEKFHLSMGTKFMIPIIGGRDLDLHRLFVEVTQRGGIHKILREKRWKEVTATFNFPSTATNASFVLRKYYGSLLLHYEQLYFFKAQGWNAAAAAPVHSPWVGHVPVQSPVLPSPQYQSQPMINVAEPPRARPESATGPSVVGVIDGKFDGGYLVTVSIGNEKLQGLLYQAAEGQHFQMSQHYPSMLSNNNGIDQVVPPCKRRRRRKKCEIKRRDPDHPKPNRSGYNFFFAEQHARLKQLHTGKDREISRMIGELWNKLKDGERIVYQEKAMKDKERYRSEMEGYRERLRTGQSASEAAPLAQWQPVHDVGMAETDLNNAGTEDVDNESSSYVEVDSDDDEKNMDDEEEDDLDREESAVHGLGVSSCDLGLEASANPCNNREEDDKIEDKRGEKNLQNMSSVEANKGSVAGTGGASWKMDSAP